MKFIFIGDIVGKGGRRAVLELTPGLKKRFGASFVIANGENSAGGNGITAAVAAELSREVDVITLGDHTWDQKDFPREIGRLENVLRPANFASGQPGCGWRVFRNPAGGEIAVINLIGRVFMKEYAVCPFAAADEILKQLPGTVQSVFVDIHAEATSEKIALARYLDGRVTAVIGTHTHVQTADARVFPGGTAYLTDVGMTGAEYSVLGRSVESVIGKFTTGMPTRLPVVETGIRLDGAVVTYDHFTGKASAIEGFSIMAGEDGGLPAE